jgi:uncharacterized protein involved in exopolysaccharide biosynthesis/Mrp family chromosome partitioning ATPase
LPEQENSGSTLLTAEGLIYMLFRRKWLILTGLILGLAGAAVVHKTTAPEFVSGAKLLIRYVTDEVNLDPATQDGRVLSPDRHGGNILNSEIEILTSQDLIGEVVDKVGIARLMAVEEGEGIPSMAHAVQVVLGRLSVNVPRDSNIIKLRFQSHDPEIAQRVLDELVIGYLDKHQRVHRASADSYDFYSRQTDKLKFDLDKTEEELQKLKNDYWVVNLETTKQMLADRFAAVKERHQHELVEHAAITARIELLKRRIGVPAETGDSELETPHSDESDDEADLARLARLYEKEAVLLQFYREESVPVRNHREIIAEIENRISHSGDSASSIPDVSRRIADDSLHDELDKDLTSLAASEARLKVLEKLLSGVEAESVELNGSESRIVRLQRQKEMQEAHYRNFQESLERARIDEAIGAEKLMNINVVEPATSAIMVSPATKKNRMAMSLLLGVGIAGGLTFLLEFIAGRSLRRPVEVERMLNVPTLITLPRDVSFGRLITFNTNGSTKLLSAGNGSPRDHVPVRSMTSLATGYFDALCYRIEMTGVLSGDIPHLIGVSSCSDRAGATTISTGLALALSRQENEKVLLVEAGGGNDSAHRMLGVEPEATLSDVLEDKERSATKVQDRLFLLSTQNGDTSMSQLSLGRRFRDLVNFLKESQFTTVIVDLPPIRETSPTLQIASLLDGIVVVLEQDKVSLRHGRRALELLEQGGAKLVGTVFNKNREFVPQWIDGGA